MDIKEAIETGWVFMRHNDVCFVQRRAGYILVVQQVTPRDVLGFGQDDGSTYTPLGRALRPEAPLSNKYAPTAWGYVIWEGEKQGKIAASGSSSEWSAYRAQEECVTALEALGA